MSGLPRQHFAPAPETAAEAGARRPAEPFVQAARWGGRRLRRAEEAVRRDGDHRDDPGPWNDGPWNDPPGNPAGGEEA